jgi:hypothetical protein
MAKDTLKMVKEELKLAVETEDVDNLLLVYLRLCDQTSSTVCCMALDELIAEDEEAIRKEGVLL